MNGRWTRVAVLALALCAATTTYARGPGGVGGGAGWAGGGMRGGGWAGGSWHGNAGHGDAWHGNAWHGGGHHDGHGHGWYGASVGIYLGPGFYWGWPYGAYAYDGWPYYDAYDGPYSYVYAYPNVTFAYPTDPSYYMEPAPAPEPPSFRYYCSDPKGYYPQVIHCTQPWLRVLPSDEAPADATPGAPSTPSGQ